MEEARKYQYSDVEEMKQKLQEEQEKIQQEKENILLDANAELECARFEAKNILDQAKLRMKQAEEKERRLISQAEAKAAKMLKTATDDLELIQKQLQNTVQRYGDLYRYLESDEEKSVEKIESFLEDTKKKTDNKKAE